jgi:hypothetical protein
MASDVTGEALIPQGKLLNNMLLGAEASPTIALCWENFLEASRPGWQP